MELNNDVINNFSDILDEAVMVYYNALKSETDDERKEVENANYLTCLTDVIDIFLHLDNHQLFDLEKEELEKLYECFEKLENIKINQEELRKALLFLEIKGFKQIHFPLDLITPDAVGVIFQTLIDEVLKKMLKNKKQKYTLLDPNFGSGNLAFVIDNFSEYDAEIWGIENNELLSTYACSKANLMMKNATIYHQDALDFSALNDKPLIVVSDIAGYDVKDIKLLEEVTYFPYLLIYHFLTIAATGSYFFYLVDTNFFSKNGSEVFKEKIAPYVDIKALVVLPNNFFLNDPKMILILEKVSDGNNIRSPKTSFAANVFMLPSIAKKDKFKETIENIKAYLED